MKCKNFIIFLLSFSFLLLLTRHVAAAVAFVIIGSVSSSCLCASSFYFSRLFMFLFTDAYDISVCVCMVVCVCTYWEAQNYLQLSCLSTTCNGGLITKVNTFHSINGYLVHDKRILTHVLASTCLLFHCIFT